MESDALAGLRILLVEDDAMLAMALEMSLASVGCDVAGLASNLTDGMALARGAIIDGAILDINLAGEKVYPIADILSARNIPFLFATGYGMAGLRECDRTRPVLQKPYELRSLVKIAKQWCKPAR